MMSGVEGVGGLQWPEMLGIRAFGGSQTVGKSGRGWEHMLAGVQRLLLV